MTLDQLGWSPVKDRENIDLNLIARITTVHKSICLAQTVHGELQLHLSGSFHLGESDPEYSPTVGDWVEISPPFMESNGSFGAILQSIVPRRTKISRKAPGTTSGEQILASNVDYAFIVVSANEDFSLNRIQRYIFLANEGGVEPVVIVSKTDLIGDLESIQNEIAERFPEQTCIYTSAVNNSGFDQCMDFIKPGSTAVVLGSSGVGKSTLVNHLMGREEQKTSAIRDDDGKGRHTTTTRNMLFIPNGGIIIDTPGLREVQIAGSEEALQSTFTHIIQWSEQCRFGDCSHGNEPGCAIQSALKNGDLSVDEWENFLKLQREQAHYVRRSNKAMQAAQKKHWKSFAKKVRQIQKTKRR